MDSGMVKNIGKTIKEALDGVLEFLRVVVMGNGKVKNIGKTIKEACDGVLEFLRVNVMGNGKVKNIGKTIKEACDGVLENVSFKTVAIVAGVALAAVAIIRVFGLFGSVSGSGSGRKTMKAPGRDGRIFRDDFASDPKKYFRGLRK